MLGLFYVFVDFFFKISYFEKFFQEHYGLGPDQDRHSVGPDLDPNCLQRFQKMMKVAAI